MSARVRVPVVGGLNKSILLNPGATQGAQIGIDLLLPDGSVASLTSLAAALGITSSGNSSGSGGIATNVLWTRIIGIPANITELAALATNGAVLRTAGNITVAVPSGDKAVLHDAAGTVTFSTVDSTYISDFTEAAQDAVGAALTNTTTIDLTYNDAGNAITADINTGSVSNSLLANVATATVKGRVAAGSGVPTDLTQTQLTTLVNAFTSSLSGAAPASGGGTSNFLRADGTWAAPPSGLTSPLTTKGDIWVYSTTDARLGVGTDGYVLSADSSQTAGLKWIPAATGSGTVTSITVASPNSTLTIGGTNPITTSGTVNIDLANIADQRVLGNVSGGSAEPVALTAAQISTFLSLVASATTDTTNATNITSGTLPIARIAAGAVTLAKLANQADQTILGNNSGGAGPPIALTAAQTKTILAITLTSDVVGTLQAAQFPALTGDITTTAGSLATAIGANKVTTTTIAANAVTLAKLATQADQTVLGNVSGGAAVPVALTQAQVRTFLGLATVATSGAYSDLTGAPTIPTGANPSASVGLTAVNGSAATFMRSDGAPALGQSIAPTWTGQHTFAPASGIGVIIEAPSGGGEYCDFTGVSGTSSYTAWYNGGTNIGYIGYGSGILSGANISDFIFRSVALMKFCAGGNKEVLRLNNQTAPTIQGWGPTAAAVVDMTPDTGTFTITLTGVTGSVTATARWIRIGQMVLLNIPAVTGTGTGTSFGFTGLPAVIQPARTMMAPIADIEDAGVLTGTFGIEFTTSGTITCYKNGSSTGFTTAGTRGLSRGQVVAYSLN